ncbi:hypothetical protein Maq22A_c28850 [Methylobacterium aquaticum]|uniref:Uncharacterized protein n=1 Tax=Methylobacterium aquaticum TaxID=270351 RepID=A0A1Y0ZGD5_9HYPH|nr:hypothetical protein Maq22A_c28850 [Methylobacterium aquaticum]
MDYPAPPSRIAASMTVQADMAITDGTSSRRILVASPSRGGGMQPKVVRRIMLSCALQGCEIVYPVPLVLVVRLRPIDQPTREASPQRLHPTIRRFDAGLPLST